MVAPPIENPINSKYITFIYRISSNRNPIEVDPIKRLTI